VTALDLLPDLITPQSLGWPAALDLYYALSPSAWARRVFEPDPWQDKLLNDTSYRIHANTSRQIGKSTTVAGKVTHRAWYRYEQLILLIAPTLRQSVELIRKVKWFLQEAGCPKSAYKSGALSIEILHTGSRIIALPGGNPDNIRGFSAPDMIVIDEASFAKDQLYRSIRPMLMTSNGQLILISTPFTKRGFFWEIADRTDDDMGEKWSRYIVPAWDCPRVDPKFLESERKAMGDWWFNSEYGGLFQEPQNSLFSVEMIQAARRKIIEPLYNSDGGPSEASRTRNHQPLYPEGAMP
jgi:hypothetical protein